MLVAHLVHCGVAVRPTHDKINIRCDSHLVHRDEQVVVDLLRDDGVELVRRVRAHEIPDPRSRGNERAYVHPS